MSMETWKAEFYPVPADKCSKENALDHSIQKWTGLYEENLKKHDVVVCLEFGYPRVVNKDNTEEVKIDGTTCALCAHYFTNFRECLDCPIVLRTGVTCGSAYRNSERARSPVMMLDLLKKTKESVVTYGNVCVKCCSYPDEFEDRLRRKCAVCGKRRVTAWVQIPKKETA